MQIYYFKVCCNALSSDRESRVVRRSIGTVDLNCDFTTFYAHIFAAIAIAIFPGTTLPEYRLILTATEKLHQNIAH